MTPNKDDALKPQVEILSVNSIENSNSKVEPDNSNKIKIEVDLKEDKSSSEISSEEINSAIKLNILTTVDSNEDQMR
jgi:hypothetical protein